MTPIDRIAVVIPAADEEGSIGHCLDSVEAARRVVRSGHPSVQVDVVVVLDHCVDGTAARVASHRDVVSVRSTARNVGVARAIGSTAALARSRVPAGRTWLAHTDADSRVPARWLLGQLTHALAGVQMLLGTVKPEDTDPTFAVWQALHTDSDGHPHVHGANLGIRGDVLTRLGGWAPLRSGEDADLVDRAVAVGARVASVGGLAVRTSSRRVGRVPAGFSSYLRDLDVDLLVDEGLSA